MFKATIIYYGNHNWVEGHELAHFTLGWVYSVMVISPFRSDQELFEKDRIGLPEFDLNLIEITNMNYDGSIGELKTTWQSEDEYTGHKLWQYYKNVGYVVSPEKILHPNRENILILIEALKTTDSIKGKWPKFKLANKIFHERTGKGTYDKDGCFKVKGQEYPYEVIEFFFGNDFIERNLEGTKILYDTKDSFSRCAERLEKHFRIWKGIE